MDTSCSVLGREATSTASPARGSRVTSQSHMAPALHSRPRLVLRQSQPGPRSSAYPARMAHGSTWSISWQDDFDEQYASGQHLGSGSFGSVFLAENKGTGQTVAVKEMPRVREGLTAERTRQKIHREVVVMRIMNDCPAVASLLGCFQHGDHYRLVMELCEGGDLTDFLQKSGPVSEFQAASVAYEILKVLHAFHEREVLHGDVKTANFMLKSSLSNPLELGGPPQRESGWLKAIDFGCSQFVDESMRMRSRVGTPAFMAPEVFKRNYSLESDMWSLGVLVYHMISGRFPFWTPAESASLGTIPDIMKATVERAPDFSYGPWLESSSEGLDFVQGLLDKNYRTRMTATAAMSHPWIKKHILGHDDVLLNNVVPAGLVLGESAATERLSPPVAGIA